tara:strand:- start:100 stop:408 length:309 start_codon:yes stop_codon:yes gene_type:complete
MTINIIQSRIESVLENSFKPIYLEVVNESGMHNVPDGSESHFKVIIASEVFTELSLIKRHQSVYKALNGIMDNIHALSMHLYDSDEYKSNPSPEDSPDCANK